MRKQVTDTLMMIRPASFHLNEETAVNNYFMREIEGASSNAIQEQAVKEFDDFVEVLRSAGIIVHVFQDVLEEDTPDSIFPNNWVSFHDEGRLIIYPMYAENRRKERKLRVYEELSAHFEITEINDQLLHSEKEGKFLEATGSLIFDCKNRIAYAAISERTHPDLLAEFSEMTGYRVVSFVANQTVDNERKPIYHTNVMMCIGEEFALICADTIDDENTRKAVLDSLINGGKEIILISEEQMEQFAGNMLQVKNVNNERFVVMSQSAFDSLSEDQKVRLGKHGSLLSSPIPTIETLGGGSARCMMAEVFLPKKSN
ncbi:MAG: amidinotransferase [Cyclobacteriaceae bacterium]